MASPGHNELTFVIDFQGTDFDLDLSLSPPLSAFSGLSGLPDDSSTVIKQPGSREGSPKSSPASKLTEPIKIAVLMGRQELRIKVKQNEELRGPKVSVHYICISNSVTIIHLHHWLPEDTVPLSFLYTEVAPILSFNSFF